MEGLTEAREIMTQVSTSKSQQKTSSFTTSDAFAYAVCGACGIVFGFAAEKGKVYVPSVIINQMLFSQFTMMKMFLSAVAASAISLVLLSALPATRNFYRSAFNAYASSVSTTSAAKSLIGGAILGAGMTLSGACPGMVLTQIGTGTQHAVFTIIGCFSGALLYGLVHNNYLAANAVPSKPKFANDNKFVIPFIGLLGGTVLAVEYFIPWTTEVPMSPNHVSPLYQLSWSPIIAGSLIGFLQLPLILAIQDTLGGSSSYCTVIANVIGQSSANGPLSYFNKFRRGVSNWWQVVYVGGAVIGGALSSTLSGTWGTTVGVSPFAAFAGGACLLFGARLASGCTSGHGISGMSLISIYSFLTVMAMFAGGISSAILLNQLHLI